MSTSTTTKTVAASTTAALLIAGGVALYNGTSESGSNEIDWSMYELNVPKIELPSLNVSSINVPSINVPSIQVQLIKLDENYALNTTSPGDLDDLDVSVPNVTLPIIDSNINNNLESLNTYVNKDIESFNKQLFGLKLEDPTKDIPEWIKFIKNIQNSFVDKRMVQHDTTMLKSNEFIKKWIEIYKEYKDKPDVQYIPIKNKFKMITEVRVPKNSEQLQILTKNLAYYKSEGYDSVLVAFDKNDTAEEVLNTIKYCIKYGKMNVWATYTGDETLKDTVFMDPDKYKNILEKIAPYIHGYINSWRRTSAHLWEQDQQFMKFTNTTLRNVSPDLPIIGELYFGNTHKFDSINNVGFGLNTFKNASAIMIVNFGFKKVDVNFLLNTVLIPYIGNTPIVACVVGQKPYYLTDNKNNLDYKENMKIKHEVEEKFMKEGCIGVVTLSNDGRYVNTNNLSETLYSSL